MHPSIVCEYFSKMGKCPIIDCKEVHRKGVAVAKDLNQDCYFWLSGSCRYSESECNKGRHVQEKFGSKRRESFLAQGPAERVSANHVPLGGQHGVSHQMMGMVQPVMGGIQQATIQAQLIMGGAAHHPHGGHQQLCSPVMGGQQSMLATEGQGQQQSVISQQQGVIGQQQGVMGQQQGMMRQQQGVMRQQQSVMGQQQGMMEQQQGSVGQQPVMVGQHATRVQHGRDGQLQGVSGLQPPMVMQHQGQNGRQPMMAGVSLLGGQQILMGDPRLQMGVHQASTGTFPPIPTGQQFTGVRESGMEWLESKEDSMNSVLGSSMNSSWQGKGMGGR